MQYTALKFLYMSETLTAQYMPNWMADTKYSTTWSTAGYLW